MTIDILTAAVIVTGVGICIVNELDATPFSGGAPARTCLLVPGNIAWDACDCDGQLALTIQRIYPTKIFPGDASSEPVLGGCLTRPLAVQVLVSLVRCIPGLDPSGNPPTCAQLLAKAVEQQADAYAIRRAVECCLDNLKHVQRKIFDYRVGGTSFVGPEGNCGGPELTFIFMM